MSNLAGSIVGLLGTIRFLMNLLEARYEKYMQDRKDDLNLRQIIQRRIEIIEKNLSSSEMNLYDQTSRATDKRRSQATDRRLCGNISSIDIDTSIQYNSYYMKRYSHS